MSRLSAALEMRVPPPVYAVLVGVLMWLVSRITPGLDVAWWIRIGIAATLVGLAIAVIGSAIGSFIRRRTTIDPHGAHRTSAIVTTGVYRITRNPMYLGMLLALLGLGVWLSNPIALATAFVFVPVVTSMQIRPEERILGERFGDPYHAYCAQVRRWL